MLYTPKCGGWEESVRAGLDEENRRIVVGLVGRAGDDWRWRKNIGTGGSGGTVWATALGQEVKLLMAANNNVLVMENTIGIADID